MILKYGLRKTCTLSAPKFHEDECVALCKYWCHRMVCFFDLFLKAGKPAAYKFTLASVQGYVPDPAIQKSVCSGRQVMRDRSQTIAAIRPRIG